ncbi:MAG: 5-formyltetrahydrofolate cyclo-ligase [Alistipes sp.]|nr:5-formyltetrahydrofolate cyclo-ligase [Alistipes sp.]
MEEKKKALRAAVRAAARGVIPTEPERMTREVPYGNIFDQIESSPQFAAARTVALYHALPDEVPTEEMLHRWLGIKRLALPVVHSGGAMTFHEYLGPGDLAPGVFGISEPRTDRQITPQEIDLMLVPGVAFDSAGQRLGRGRGFYDRYLSQPAATHIYKVGLCHSGALVPEIPAETHDVAMNRIVTS